MTFFTGQARIWKSKFDVCAISADKPWLEEFGKAEGIRTHHIPMERDISLWKDFYCLILFIVFFIKERPEVVHGNTPKGALLSMLAAWLTRRPVRIYMCHGLRYEGFSGRFRRLLMFMEKLTCRCATQVITVSNSAREVLIADGICDDKKVKVVGYGSLGIDLTHYTVDNDETHIAELRKKYGVKTSDFVYLFVGRLVRDKGLVELVNAFQRMADSHPDAHLVIVGGKLSGENDSIPDSLFQVIEDHPQITYVGRQSDVRPFFTLSNVFVLPSYREGLSIVLIEASAMGRPAITCNVTGCKDIIANGENGWVIPSHSEDALYAAMAEAYDYPERLAELGNTARSVVRERYEQQKVWQAYWDEYKRLANEQ